ncbi:Putative transmembrane protein [Colletotrichum destructivum]|uniref:Transmembrane protein n=1 Tax=Colletotrichum destructivum TaxID=34406 RepID=A0AAX4IEK7_9PEZI|nr:Putative transmembrane protein [Colletotrichum destructivum]
MAAVTSLRSAMIPRSQMQTRRKSIIELHGIPPILRPLLRAYFLGYASAVAPRILTLLMQYITRKRRKTLTENGQCIGFVTQLRRIVLAGLDPQRFPTFCALIVGGSTLLEEPLRRLFERNANGLAEATRTRLARWSAAFIAAWFSLQLLQSKKSSAFTENVPVKSDVPPGAKLKEVRYAGRTLDLTLFTLTRALDVIVGELWARRRARRIAEGSWTKAERIIGRFTDPSLFVTSCAFIMWAWFYHPSRLPSAYNKWISSAANVDMRLIEALQKLRAGEMAYGQSGQAELLQSMCEKYKWPIEWGDPSKSIPIPCEMVHMGCGPSCELHAISRFYRSWKWSMAMYLPLSVALLLRGPINRKSVLRTLVSASRSAAFLGTYITLFYYGVCLARTRIGPHVIGKDLAARQKIDAGICVRAGCCLCGWSVLVESVSRRKDMALFVAPRAMATLLPRRYGMDKQWRETLVFAASTAVVFTCIHENQARVRGVLGGVLGLVLRN